MPVLRCQVAQERDTLLPVDRVVNTWFFSDGTVADPAAGDTDAIVDGLTAFYEETHTWGSSVLTGSGTISIYNMSDPEPRAPIVDVGFTHGTARTDQSLPSEVAVCLSFQGAPLSGVSQARRRGRLYLGPFSTAILETSPTELSGDVRPEGNFRAAVAAGLGGLVDEIGPAGYVHVVYSPTRNASGSTLLESVVSVASYSMDDAFDIQRRRGAEATARVAITPA